MTQENNKCGSTQNTMETKCVENRSDTVCNHDSIDKEIREIFPNYNPNEEDDILDDNDNFVLNNWPDYAGKFQRDTPILHFIKKKYFLKMLLTGQNTLMHVSTWEDVWEGFIFKLKYELSGNPLSLERVYQDFFGQCWSMCRYPTEILWHARCPDNDGVCLMTTVGQLAQSILVSIPPKWIQYSFALNAVKYYGRGKLKRFVKSFCQSSQQVSTTIFDPQALKRLFFIKSNEFADEQEVRLLFLAPGSPIQSFMSCKKSSCSYPINGKGFLNAVLVDPRMSKSEYQSIQRAVKQSGWTTASGNPLKIRQSSMYQFPNWVVKL